MTRHPRPEEETTGFAALLRWVDRRSPIQGLMLGGALALCIVLFFVSWPLLLSVIAALMIALFVAWAWTGEVWVYGVAKRALPPKPEPAVPPVVIEGATSEIDAPEQPPPLPEPPDPPPSPLGPKPFDVRQVRVKDADFNEIALPGGEFLMGSAEEDKTAYEHEKPQHAVRVSGFWMMEVPVTQALWEQVMQEKRVRPENHPTHPINDVRWFDAIDFCNRLSDIEGLDRCYTGERETTMFHPERNGYRLPTEAEWEYACRAGTTSRWYWGDTDEKIDGYVWWSKNSGNTTHPVKEKLPNQWELYDMAGNVWEWCWDWHGLYSKNEKSPSPNPIGPPKGEYRVVRGGSFDGTGTGNLRSADRDRDYPRVWLGNVGFRCVRVFVP